MDNSLFANMLLAFLLSFFCQNLERNTEEHQGHRARSREQTLTEGAGRVPQRIPGNQKSRSHHSAPRGPSQGL